MTDLETRWLAEYDRRALEITSLRAEVAQLRAEAKRCANGWDAAALALRTERAAHEATKAEVVKALGELNLARIRSQAHHNRAEAAEARVTELERKNEGLGRAKDKFASRAYLAEARITELEAIKPLLDGEALAQAREEPKLHNYGQDSNCADCGVYGPYCEDPLCDFEGCGQYAEKEQGT